MSSTRIRSPEVRLREVRDEDLPLIFEFQREPESVAMVGIGTRDREEFDAHWARIRVDRGTVLRTICADGAVAGWAVSFPLEGRTMAGYWLGRAFWGRGIASVSLSLLLGEVDERPLWATVLAENTASRRVLEKNGFDVADVGEEEVLYVLG